MPCRPAITHRNANGQLRQIEMMTRAKKLLCPISQNDGLLVMPSVLCSSWFTRPLLYWNMNDQMMTEAYTGSANGVRKIVRSAARPRKVSWVRIAAVVPNSQENPTASTVKPQVTRNECSSALPIAWLKFSATR